MTNLFKLTKSKILILIGLFVASIIIRSAVNETGYGFLKTIEKLISPHYFMYGSVFSSEKTDIVSASDVLMVLLVFIVGILYWYLLSCLIVYLYKKLQK